MTTAAFQSALNDAADSIRLAAIQLDRAARIGGPAWREIEPALAALGSETLEQLADALAPMPATPPADEQIHSAYQYLG